MSSLPIGWGSRSNAWDPESADKETRAGDWRTHTLELRYTSSALAVGGDEGVPPVWAMRENSKTLEELSLSKSACAVAVAEVVLKSNSSDGKSEQRDAIPERMRRSEDALPELSSLSLLASAIMRMDEKMSSQQAEVERKLGDLENNMVLLLKRQELMMQTLQRLSDRTRGDSE